MERPVHFSNRAFSVEPITSVMLPDGIFDTAINVLDICFFVTNSSNTILDWAWVRHPNGHQTEWAYLHNTFTPLGRLAPGASKLVQWRANFRNCTPGKKSLLIEFGCAFDETGGHQGFDGIETKPVFVSRTVDGPDGSYTCEVPEGLLNVRIVRESVIPGWRTVAGQERDGSISIPPIGIPTELLLELTPTPGHEDDIPFADPWWKVIAWVVAAIAAIAALIAAKNGKGTVGIGITGHDAHQGQPEWCIPAVGSNPDSFNLAGALSTLASAAARVGMMDHRDPMQKGRDAFPLAEVGARLREVV